MTSISACGAPAARLLPEYLTVGWNIAEGVIAIGSGVFPIWEPGTWWATLGSNQ